MKILIYFVFLQSVMAVTNDVDDHNTSKTSHYLYVKNNTKLYDSNDIQLGIEAKNPDAFLAQAIILLRLHQPHYQTQSANDTKKAIKYLETASEKNQYIANGILYHIYKNGLFGIIENAKKSEDYKKLFHIFSQHTIKKVPDLKDLVIKEKKKSLKDFFSKLFSQKSELMPIQKISQKSKLKPIQKNRSILSFGKGNIIKNYPLIALITPRFHNNTNRSSCKTKEFITSRHKKNH